jgi:hypothetical protein
LLRAEDLEVQARERQQISYGRAADWTGQLGLMVQTGLPIKSKVRIHKVTSLPWTQKNRTMTLAHGGIRKQLTIVPSPCRQPCTSRQPVVEL